MELRYGINPEQVARASLDEPGSPLRVVSGAPSYVNVLDALGAWQLVREASRSLGAPAAASFKHVSPAGAALAGAVDDVMEAVWGVRAAELSPVASAYVRARDADPRSSFGDFVAVSEPVDAHLADVLAGVISDGIVAPGFEPGTAEVLRRKKAGRFLVFEADPVVEPPVWEAREVFGVRLEQQTSRARIDAATVTAAAGHELPAGAADDLALAMIAARYTQSNSVAYVRGGMVLGVGAGQQSRVDCTALAGGKVGRWWLRRHPKVGALRFRSGVRRQDRINWQLRYLDGDMTAAEAERFDQALAGRPAPFGSGERRRWLDRLDGVAVASDGAIPFRDNIDEAARYGTRYLIHPGGSARDDDVEAACAEHGITLVTTGIRLFLH